ncbi:hypothetical protein T439DRAFT_323942 [Meredithblackwellia eburnea MCA 4105]
MAEQQASGQRLPESPSTSSLTATAMTGRTVYRDKFVLLTAGPHATLTLFRYFTPWNGETHIPLSEIDSLYPFNGGPCLTPSSSYGSPSEAPPHEPTWLLSARLFGLGITGTYWSWSFRMPTRMGMARSYIAEVRGRWIKRIGFDVEDNEKFTEALSEVLGVEEPTGRGQGNVTGENSDSE